MCFKEKNLLESRVGELMLVRQYQFPVELSCLPYCSISLPCLNFSLGLLGQYPQHLTYMVCLQLLLIYRLLCNIEESQWLEGWSVAHGKGCQLFIPSLNSWCYFSEEALQCSSPRLSSQLLPAALGLACSRGTQWFWTWANAVAIPKIHIGT